MKRIAQKTVKFLDRPYLWVAYLIIGMYVMTVAIAALRGLVKYNRVLDRIETNELTDPTAINKILIDSGFRDDIHQKPRIKDYIWAGLK